MDITKTTKHILVENQLPENKLADLPNAFSFFAQAERMLAENGTANYNMLFFNIVNFKICNDFYGYDKGDALLTEVAEVLLHVFDGSIVGRLGADNFVVITAVEDVQYRILLVHDRIEDNSLGIPFDMRAGICPVEGNGHMSFACDRAKMAYERIKNVYGVIYENYDEHIREELLEKKYIMDHLDEAIEKKYLQVYYQPIVRACTGKICAVESLIRWNDPQRGMLSPASFVPILEETRAIHRIDQYVLGQLCEDMAARRAAGLEIIPASINLSQLDFQLCDIYDVICKATKEYQISHKLIHIEITESALSEDSNHVKETVDRFREAGFEVWLDDFGSEYSTLNSLQHYDMDVLKIDKKFIEGMRTNWKSKIIVSAVINMGKQLGYSIVAEGIECEEDFIFLKESGCDKIQGYYFYRPLQREAIRTLDNVESDKERENFDRIG